MLANRDVQFVMDALQRAIPVPQFEIVMHRALGWQVFGQGLPLAASPQDIENPVQHLAHIDRASTPAMPSRRDHGLHNRPFGISQIAWVTKAASIRGLAVFRCPHRALSRESSAQQGITSDSSDSRSFRIGSQIYARQGIDLDRSTLADWVGRAAFMLQPVHERLLAVLKASSKLFADETTAPVLDPGRGRTKIGQLWAYARDDRPWGGSDPPGVAYVYAPDRKAKQPIAHLAGFTGILQVDGYSGYRALAERNDVQLAFCWSHVRRPFYELAAAGPAPIASEALERIAGLYAIEKEIRGRSAEERRAVRQDKSRPIIDDLEPWLKAKLALISQKTKLATAIRYALSRWNGLTRFLDDGQVEIDSNVVERSIRPIALNRKNALFAGSDGGGEHWAVIASLIETCKLNGMDPHTYLSEIITKIVNGHPNSRIDELLPWAYPAAQLIKDVA